MYFRKINDAKRQKVGKNGREKYENLVPNTKYAHFCALSHTFKVITIPTSFMETIQKLHGNPKIIVSDKDSIFNGNFWK